MASLCTVRQVKTCTTTGPRPRPMMRRDLVSPWLALIGLGVGDFLPGVSIGDGADVPPVGGMLDESFPDLLPQLEPRRHSLGVGACGKTGREQAFSYLELPAGTIGLLRNS